MNAFLEALGKHEIKSGVLTRGELTTLQVNMGDLCNQTCAHCHIAASPGGKQIMPKEITEDILGFLQKTDVAILDITGGAPELNPFFDDFVTAARGRVRELIVRSNLTVFFEEGRGHLPEFFKKNKVHLICSLPCYTQKNVDSQRGKGVFEKSIRALTILNALGFSKDADLPLDIVYNPGGAFLPGAQSALEQDYKKVLREQYGITFNRLLTITNVAINKFKKQLESKNEYEKYSRVLAENFNPRTLPTLMCRSFLSVGHDGRLYDCDFNLALGLALQDDRGDFLTIGDLNPTVLGSREIATGEHCLACTAGSGSSCQGALANDPQEAGRTGTGGL